MQINKYLEDSYCYDFESAVIDVRIIKKRTAIAVEKNIFYPGGGGQPIDHGEIIINNNELAVIDIKKVDKKVFLILNEKFDIQNNCNVLQKVNPERRFVFMRYHSAAHILMASVNKNVEKYEPEGIEISDNCSSCIIKFNCMGVVEKNTIEKIINNANTAIAQNMRIFAINFDDISIPMLKYKDIFRVADPQKGNVRVLIIDGWDANPCGGTHVNFSHEIGTISYIAHDNYSITFSLSGA